MDSIESAIFNDETKRDSRGRKVVTAEECQRLLEAYRKSGLIQRTFSERESSVPDVSVRNLSQKCWSA